MALLSSGGNLFRRAERIPSNPSHTPDERNVGSRPARVNTPGCAGVLPASREARKGKGRRDAGSPRKWIPTRPPWTGRRSPPSADPPGQAGYRYLQVPLKMARDRTYDRRTEKESPEIGESIARQPAPTVGYQMVKCDRQHHDAYYRNYNPDQPLHPTPEKIAKLFTTPDFVDFLFVFNVLTFFKPPGFGDAPGIVRLGFQLLRFGLRDFPGIRRGVIPGHESFAFAA